MDLSLQGAHFFTDHAYGEERLSVLVCFLPRFHTQVPLSTGLQWIDKSARAVNGVIIFAKVKREVFNGPHEWTDDSLRGGQTPVGRECRQLKILLISTILTTALLFISKILLLIGDAIIIALHYLMVRRIWCASRN